MKCKMCMMALGLILTFGLSAEEAPSRAAETVDHVALEALLVPETPVSLTTLYSCEVRCFDATLASFLTASEAQCIKKARQACGSQNCQYWFAESSTGLCIGGL